MTQFYVVDTAQNAYPLNIYQETVSELAGVQDSYNPTFNIIMQAVVIKTATLNNSQYFSTEMVDAVGAREANNSNGGAVYWEQLLGSLTPSSAANFVSGIVLQEYVIPSFIPLMYGNSDWAFSEIVTNTSQLLSYYTKLISEIISSSDKQMVVPAWVLQAAVKSKGSLYSEAFYNLVKAEHLIFSSALVSTLTLKIAEAVSTSISTLVAVRKLASLRDSLFTKGIVTSAFEAAIFIQEALRIAYQTTAGKGASIAEQIKFTAAYTAIFGFGAKASDGLLISASSTPALVFVLEVSDAAKIIDPAGAVGGFDPTQFLGLLLDEQVSVKIGYNSDDGLWTGWVMNTQNAAVTNYSDWNFNSFATLSTVDVAASSTGLYALGGTNDSGAPISAMATFAKSDFGDSRLKRMPYAYIGVRATGQLYFITETDDGVERVYSLVATTSGPHTERVQMARGVASRYWQFTLENVAGADFRLDELELLPVTLSRRV